MAEGERTTGNDDAGGIIIGLPTENQKKNKGLRRKTKRFLIEKTRAVRKLFGKRRNPDEGIRIKCCFLPFRCCFAPNYASQLSEIDPTLEEASAYEYVKALLEGNEFYSDDCNVHTKH